jgi:serine/threonine-protein kinase
MRLLTEVPDEMPATASAELEAARAQARRATARVSAFRYLTWLVGTPVLLWMGVREPLVAAATFGAVATSAAIAWWAHRRGRGDERSSLLIVAASSVALIFLNSLAGVFLIVPGLVAINTLYFSLHADRASRRLITLAGLAAILLPIALELIGLVPPAYRFADGAIHVLPRMTALPANQTLPLLLAINVALVVTPGVMAGRVRDALAEAERRLFLQAWQLRQVLPDGARPTIARR